MFMEFSYSVVVPLVCYWGQQVHVDEQTYTYVWRIQGSQA